MQVSKELTISPEQALFIARQHIDRGRFADAEGLCRRVLRDQPKCGQTLHLLGIAIARAGRPLQAIPFFSRATIHHADDFELHLDLGRACIAADAIDQAIAVYRHCAVLGPDRAEPQAKLGVLLNKSHRYAEACRALTSAIALDPNSAECHFHLGVALANDGQPVPAIAAYEKAINLEPSLPEPHANLGVLFRAAGKMDRAMACYQAALAIDPHCPEVHCNLGVALAERGEVAQAIDCYRTAVAFDPAFANGHYNLANALRRQDEHDRAIEAYRRAIELNPEFAQAYSNMAMSFNDLGRHDEALNAYDRAVELRPDWAEARWNRSLTHLLRGNFERGWMEFDCRNQIDPPSSRAFPGERWDGQDLRGKTILLHYEMGLGDTIQFARFVPWVAERGGRVILECPEPLRELFHSVDGAAEVISIQRDRAILNYDVQCSLMRLPELFRVDPSAVAAAVVCPVPTRAAKTFPTTVPYLQPPESRRAKWREKLGPKSPALRVGIVWAGRPEHQNDRQRSIRLESLSPLAALTGIEFFSLQRGPAAAEAQSPRAG